MTELDSKWETEIKKLAKTNIYQAFGECQQVLCDICEREECSQGCVELHHQMRELIKNPPRNSMVQYDGLHRILCKELCERKDCHQDCAVIHRIIRHMLVQAREK